MEIHQITFLEAVALAGAVALSTAVWDKSEEKARVQAAGAAARQAEIRKDPVRLGALATPQARIDDTTALARKTRVSKDSIARP